MPGSFRFTLSVLLLTLLVFSLSASPATAELSYDPGLLTFETHDPGFDSAANRRWSSGGNGDYGSPTDPDPDTVPLYDTGNFRFQNPTTSPGGRELVNNNPTENYVDVHPGAFYEIAYWWYGRSGDNWSVARTRIGVDWYQDGSQIGSTDWSSDRSLDDPDTWQEEVFQVQAPTNADTAVLRHQSWEDGTTDDPNIYLDGFRFSPQIAVSIDSPPDGHDTDVQDIAVQGTSSFLDAGDPIEIYVNGSSQVNTTVDADSTWSASGVTLDGIEDELKVEGDTDGMGVIADSDVVTVNYNDTNLILPYNWDMEDTGPDPPSTAMWEERGTESGILHECGTSYRGDCSLRIDDPTSSFGGREVASETVAVSPDRTYEVRAQFNVSTNPSDKDIRLAIEWINNSGGVISTGQSSDLHTSTSSTWEQLSFSAQAPTDAVEARFVINAIYNNNNDGATIDIDNAEFVDVTTSSLAINNLEDGHDTHVSSITVSGTTAFADAGDLVEVGVDGAGTETATVQNDADGSWSVSGVPLSEVGHRVKTVLYEGSTSSSDVTDTQVFTVNYNDTNLVFPYNADMEDAGEDPPALEHWYELGSAGISQDCTESFRGSCSLLFSDLTQDYDGREVASETFPVTSGEDYQVRSHFRVTNAGSTEEVDLHVQIAWYDSSDNRLDIEPITGSNLSATQSWEELTYSAQAPSSAEKARIYIRGKESGTQGFNANVDEVEFVEASPAPPRVNDLGSTATVNPPDTGVNLFWSYGSSADTFNVYRVRGTADTSGASLLESVSAEPDTNTYRDNGATRGDSHFYYVTAERSSGGESDSSPSTTAPYVTFEKTSSVAGTTRPGETITYTIDYTNEGFGPAEQLRIVDALPAETVLADTAEVVAGPSVADVEYSPDNGSTWRTSSYPRPDVDQVRWTVEETVDPRTSGTSGTVRFRVKIE